MSRRPKYPNEVDVAVGHAMCTELLKHILEPIRTVARDAGYAILVHGSLSRDIDLVAIPWVETHVMPADFLVTRIAAVVASISGRCNAKDEWTAKPHGRCAKTLIVWGERFGHIEIDLSVMPIVQRPQENELEAKDD